jgi:hypothetical protein
VWTVAPPLGWCNELYCDRSLIPVPNTDVGAWFGMVTHRLVSPTGVLTGNADSQWLVQCGMDYYPLLQGGGAGSIGQGRMLRAKPYWRSSFYAVDDGSGILAANPPFPIGMFS